MISKLIIGGLACSSKNNVQLDFSHHLVVQDCNVPKKFKIIIFFFIRLVKKTMYTEHYLTCGNISYTTCTTVYS